MRRERLWGGWIMQGCADHSSRSLGSPLSSLEFCSLTHLLGEAFPDDPVHEPVLFFLITLIFPWHYSLSCWVMGCIFFFFPHYYKVSQAGLPELASDCHVAWKMGSQGPTPGCHGWMAGKEVLCFVDCRFDSTQASPANSGIQARSTMKGSGNNDNNYMANCCRTLAVHQTLC